MTAMTCIGEPVSWLRLEEHALAEDAAVARHLDACSACRAAFATIEADRDRALPPLGDLAIAAAARRRRALRTRWLAAATVAAAAAVVLLAVLRREPKTLPGIKGGDGLVLDLVRERSGEVVAGPVSYRDGDRFEVLVTCARRGALTVDLTVEQAGQTFTPLAPAQVRCGNRVPLPGAFSLTGTTPARVCARAAGAVSCVALAPELR
jgi:hypothetical protein